MAAILPASLRHMPPPPAGPRLSRPLLLGLALLLALIAGVQLGAVPIHARDWLQPPWAADPAGIDALAEPPSVANSTVTASLPLFTT